jgi:hypothetical protein
MPRAKESWRALSAPTTALQRGAFMDSCVAWLVHEPEVQAPSCFEATTLEGTVVTPTGALTHLDVHNSSHACKCGNQRAAVLANPYAQRCLFLFCSRCQAF